MNKFDEAAATWDDSPQRAERARVVAGQVRNRLARARAAGRERGTAIELGCGTGLLGFLLRDDFESIALADSSPGMIAQVEGKIAASGARGVRALLLDLERAGALPGGQEAALMLMALHHVADVGRVLRLALGALVPGGSFLVADLVSEDGSFHAQEPGFAGHDGFDPAGLAEEAVRAGFARADHALVYEVEREVAGRVRRYPVFLLEAVR